MSDVAILSACGIRKRLGHASVLRDLELVLVPGELAIVRGANGSGKSTLLRLLSGQLRPDTGVVTVCGAGFGRGKPDGRHYLSYMPDHNEAFLELSAREFLALFYSLRRVRLTAQDMARESRLVFPDWSGRRMKTLSFGQRKRVCLAAALASDPPLLLLDEPSNGLDVDGIALLVECLRQRADGGCSTLIATHQCEPFTPLNPRCLVLEQGRLRESDCGPTTTDVDARRENGW